MLDERTKASSQRITGGDESITGPLILTEGLPNGYRILWDEQDGYFYPQRMSGSRFAVRIDLGSGSLDDPICFVEEQAARMLIVQDSLEPRSPDWGSILYTEADLRHCISPHLQLNAFGAYSMGDS
jgi:hypothetical protein